MNLEGGFYMPVKMDYQFVNEKNSYEDVMPKLLNEARNIQNKQIDFVANKVYQDGENLVFIANGEEKVMNVTEFAFAQYCTKIGMSVAFYNKLANAPIVELREMAVRNVNMLAKHYENDMLIRTNSDVIRGVLSPRYTPFDNYQILELLDDELRHNETMALKDLNVRGYVNNPDIFHMRITSARPMSMCGVESGIYPGLSIATSNIGTAKLSVNFLLYRQVCSNGMVVSCFNKSLISQVHVNISINELISRLRYSFMMYPSIALKAEHMVAKASNIKISNTLLEPGERGFRRETIKNKLNVSEKDMEEITKILRENYPATVWGYTNAITEFSKTKDFAKRIELERLAGDILLDPDLYALIV